MHFKKAYNAILSAFHNRRDRFDCSPSNKKFNYWKIDNVGTLRTLLHFVVHCIINRVNNQICISPISVNYTINIITLLTIHNQFERKLII